MISPVIGMPRVKGGGGGPFAVVIVVAVALLRTSSLLLFVSHANHLAVLAFAPSTNSAAFLTTTTQSSHRHTATSTELASSGGGGNNKKVGGGMIPFPPGDLRLFDPNVEGKLQGTDELQRRIREGPDFSPPPPAAFGVAAGDVVVPPTANGSIEPGGMTAAGGVEVEDAQHWLEDLGLPLNFAKPTSPVTATILGAARIIGDDAPGDIRHIVMRLPEGMHYVEGQSLSVIPPGVDAKNGRPHKPRLYSIASTRYGDLLDGNTVSLCVRRAVYHDPVTGAEDPTKAGVCSNFLCDTVPGTEVSVAGPVGKTMLLPDDPDADVIMIATGTGIAPFRAFMHRLFMENTVSRHMFGGSAWLVLGVPTTSGLLYDAEFRAMQENASPGALRIDYAISREMKNANGGKLYVQDVIAQNADELFRRLDGGAVVYFCGLKGMMPPILETLDAVAAARGLEWSTKLQELKGNGQWHVEVY